MTTNEMKEIITVSILSEDGKSTLHKYNKCDSICYTSTECGKAVNFCKNYVIQIHVEDSVVKEMCKIGSGH